MEKKKICFIAQFPPPIHGLSKAVETLYNSAEINKEFELEKVDITNNKKIFKNLNLIRKSNADLFYFTISQTRGGNLRDLIFLKLLEIQKKKCLIHLHGGYYRTLVDSDLPKWQRKANYTAIGKVNGAIVLGNSLRWIFKGMLPEEKIHVVPNCVDDECLMSDEDFEKKINNIPVKKVKHVLYLSNFIREKGYPEVLEMAKVEKDRYCQSKVRKFHFDFAGAFLNKVDEIFFNEYVRTNALEDFVTYHGIIAGEKKRVLLKTSDIFVLITDYAKEGQPISIIEAMGNGCLIIATKHAGIPDIIQTGYNGIFVDKQNATYDTIENLLMSEDFDLKYILKNARQSVLSNYIEETYLMNMKNIMAHIMQGGGSLIFVGFSRYNGVAA